TYEKPVISGNDVLIGNCKMQIIGDSLISYEEIPITDERLKWSWKHDIYRIIVTPRVQKIMIALL
ncbi:MAG: heparinase, partial [Lachnospiraceae bacterium]|nr:heparinase [Lachnospiraceae bacterium]